MFCALTAHTQNLLQQELYLAKQRVACTTAEAGITGLFLIPDFISEAEEQQLLAHIDTQPWQYLAKRRVQHYGYKFEYTQRGVDLKQQVGAMPEWSQDVLTRVQVRGERELLGGVACGGAGVWWWWRRGNIRAASAA